MKKIQFISLNENNKAFADCTTISNPKALDSYEINIIDLTNSEIWCCPNFDRANSSYIKYRQDLDNLNDMINNSKSSIQLLLLPDNININHSLYGGRYTGSEQLKNELSFFASVLNVHLGCSHLLFGFEPNTTTIIGKQLQSDFYFKTNDFACLTKANKTEKVTTIQMLNKVLTFIQFTSDDDLLNMLKQVGLLNESLDYPKWLIDYCFDDDKQINESILKNEQEIERIKEEIGQLNEKKKQNLHFKTALTESGESLVKIVFEIFKEILGKDLTTFVDEYAEDFLFKHEGITYIGEIKGINDGVGNSHISQVDNHKDLYEEKLAKEGKEETIKKLLVINDQRKTPISERQPIHQNQIDKAIRYDTLIIRTIDLLNVLNLYRNKKISRETIFQMIKEQTGQIKY